MSEADSAVQRDFFWKMYQENCTQGRHHEVQRSTVATALVAISAAAIGLATWDKLLTLADLPLTVLIVAIGVFGIVFSLKHYERFCLHTERARAYRDELDTLIVGSPLLRLKTDADNINRSKHPRLFNLKLHRFWTGLYIFLIFLGAIMSISLFFTAP